MEESLHNAFVKNFTDKHEHGYAAMYGRVMCCKRHIDSILEFGIAQGSSLIAFADALPSTKIYGVDSGADVHTLKPECVEDPNIKMLHGYRSDNKFDWRPIKMKLFDRKTESDKQHTDMFDIIIDDADHNIGAQLGTFLLWHTSFKEVYVIEDIMKEEWVDILNMVVRSYGYVTCVEESTKDDGPNPGYIMAIAKKGSGFGNTFCN
tara:strand:+ start:1411 stop:2028 length:618 start_codon:yes stop_codon:yes gene_type:complete